MFLRSLSRRAERNRSVVEVSKGRSEGFYVGNVCSIPFFYETQNFASLHYTVVTYYYM